MVISMTSSVCAPLQGRAGAPAGKWRGLRLHASFLGLRRAGFLLRSGLVEFLLYAGDAGEGADVDLVVVGLEALLALALGAASAKERAQEAAKEAKRNREQRRVHKREDGVYRDDRSQGRLRVRAGHHVRAEYDQDYAREQADQDAHNRPCGVEPLPEDRKQNNRHVGARGDREGERDQESYIEARSRYRQ